MVASKKKTNKGKGKAKSVKEESVEKVTAPTRMSEEDLNRIVNKAGSAESNTEVNYDRGEVERVDAPSTTVDMQAATVSKSDVPRNIQYSISLSRLIDIASRYAEGFNDAFRNQVAMDNFQRTFMNEGSLDGGSSYRDAFLNGLSYMYNSDSFRLENYPKGVAPSDVLVRFANDLGFDSEVDLMSFINYGATLNSNSEQLPSFYNFIRVLSLLTNANEIDRPGGVENEYLTIVSLFRDVVIVAEADFERTDQSVTIHSFEDSSQNILNYSSTNVPGRLSRSVSEFLASWTKGKV